MLFKLSQALDLKIKVGLTARIMQVGIMVKNMI